MANNAGMFRTSRHRLPLALAALLAAPGGPLGCGHAPPTTAPPAAPAPRVLLFTKSSGFEHPILKATPDGSPHLVERLTRAHLAPLGIEIVHSKDGGLFTPEGLRRFAALILYTNGDLYQPGTDGQPPFPPGGKEALLARIHEGLGVVAIHAPTDAFHSPGDRFEHNALDQIDPFLRVLGGEFVRHGEQQPARVLVAAPDFPGLGDLGPSFELTEEWYTFKNFAPDLRVLLVLETEGMRGDDYARPRFPVAWARKHGQGRVFYTALGHRDDVWESALFRAHLQGAVRWALGLAEADLTPNLEAVTPEAHVLQANPARIPRN